MIYFKGFTIELFPRSHFLSASAMTRGQVVLQSHARCADLLPYEHYTYHFLLFFRHENCSHFISLSVTRSPTLTLSHIRTHMQRTHTHARSLYLTIHQWHRLSFLFISPFSQLCFSSELWSHVFLFLSTSLSFSPSLSHTHISHLHSLLLSPSHMLTLSLSLSPTTIYLQFTHSFSSKDTHIWRNFACSVSMIFFRPQFSAFYRNTENYRTSKKAKRYWNRCCSNISPLLLLLDEKWVRVAVRSLAMDQLGLI